MNDEQAAQLRERFPDELVGKLPRVSCKDCGDNKQARHCAKHKMIRCDVCGNWITEAHKHIDYIGHAAATDRLLKVDREWTWHPVAYDEQGLPRIDANGGLWIVLEIAGVKRLGYGAADGKKGPNAVKEAIGDAIRNAAMRFGVALDLWAKADLSVDDAAAPEKTDPKPAAAEQRPSQQRQPQQPNQTTINAARVAVLKRAISRAELDEDAVRRVIEAVTGQAELDKITLEHYDQVVSGIGRAGAGAAA